MNKILSDIAYMRPVLILILVFYHAFAISNGGWDTPAGFKTNMAYEWMANYAYSYMLEAFTFMSGFVFAFQCYGLKKNKTFWELTKKKFQRLIVPSIIFGILYIVLFYDLTNIDKIVYDICLGGVGHLWYLPMLFWCFLISWLLNRYTKRLTVRLIFIVVMALFSFVPLPFRMTSSMFFFLFFYLGQICYHFSDKLMKIVTARRLVLGWFFYLFFFYVMYMIQENLTDKYVLIIELYKRIPVLAFINLVHITYSTVGTLLFYLTANHYSLSHNVSDCVIKVGGYCFGIYIFQQFILKGLYFHTALPKLIPSLVLPWIGFMVALVISYLLTSLLMRYKLGKQLIG